MMYLYMALAVVVLYIAIAFTLRYDVHEYIKDDKIYYRVYKRYLYIHFRAKYDSEVATKLVKLVGSDVDKLFLYTNNGDEVILHMPHLAEMYTIYAERKELKKWLPLKSS